MTITKKAFIIVIGNIVITFVVALLARNIIINPRLLAIEHTADQKDVARFEQALGLYKDTLEGQSKANLYSCRNTSVIRPLYRLAASNRPLG
jgi:ABC-type dipeptide/oligopeptide/nickel transport system permease component